MIHEFQCCFCKMGIKETKTDPIDINIILNEDNIKKQVVSRISMLILTVFIKDYIKTYKVTLLIMTRAFVQDLNF